MNMKHALMALVFLATPTHAQESDQTRAILRAIGQSVSNSPACIGQTDLRTGSVTFSPGCDQQTMERMTADAQRQRPTNGGDMADIGKKLDRIIELLEKSR